MKKIFVFIILLTMFVGVQNTFACSPGPEYPYSMEDNFERHDNVFVGRVTSIVQDKSVEGTYRIQFETIKVYKGDFDHSVVVTTNGSSAACGYDEALGIFNKNSIWAIYASEDLQTLSISQNQQYESEEKALAALDAVIGIPKVCTMQYDPVCGRKDTGIRCVTTPCDSSEVKTYGNSCMLAADKAEYLYEGECKDGGLEAPPGTVKPEPTDSISTTTQSNIDATTTVEVETPKESLMTKIINFLKNIIFFWK